MITLFGKLSLRSKLGLLYASLLITSVALVSYYSYWNIWQLIVKNETAHLRARAKPIIEHWLVEHDLTSLDSIQTGFLRIFQQRFAVAIPVRMNKFPC